ncbi:MAG TPA: prolipoprotein diacylglyceryl transferase [Hyphomicrobiaceae bacterium]|nr:prolipoprotein diacylglyceryl transferase [Hyphomicrobiaceae bacterium]
MSILAIPYPEIDPVALEIGPIAIKWYGLAYVAGLLIGWLYIKRMLAETRLWFKGEAPFAPARADDLLIFMTVGVVAGGRLGFVLLYEPSYYLRHPLEIFAIWQGGMAFHGALLGCGLAIWLFARWANVSPLSAMDLTAAAVPIGLFFGRIANFINGELYGRPTTLPWGMVFPETRLLNPGVEPEPRHPSQLYEAFFEGLVLFLLLRWLTHRQGALKSPGLVTGAFLIGYGIARSFCELFREPNAGHLFTVGVLTPGIAYSIPMILLGIWFIWMVRSRAVA